MTQPPSDAVEIDAAARRQLADYVRGRRSADAALAAIVEALPQDARTIIDLRCGIGWSTSEFGRARPTATVHGWDPRPSSIAVAGRLFGGPRLSFATAVPEPAAWRAFDVATAIVADLAELDEIETGARGGLAELLSAGGQLLIAIPLGRGEGDRPTDGEAAGWTNGLAAQVGAPSELIASSPQMAAYRISGPRTARAPTATRSDPPKPLPGAQRHRLVLDRLGRSVTDDGYVIPKRGSVRVLIVSQNRARLSESFVKANIEGLPAHVDVLFGQPPALEDEHGDSIVSNWAGALGRVASVASSRAATRLDASWLERAVAARKPAVVLAEYGPTGVALLDVCRRRSIPLVTQFFGYDASEQSVLESLRDGYRKLLRYGHAVAVSRDIAQRLGEIAGSPDRIDYVPCGVDPETFGGADPANSKPWFLGISRFVEKKAPHLTILAFKEVLAAVPEARLRFVGGGPLLLACRQLVDALGIAGSVDFLGFKRHHELLPLYRESRAFVQHSMTSPTGDREGTPVAILEAGATGLPVVSTRHAGIPDVVVEGETGLLVDEGDYLGMADAMIQLARDPALAARLGRSAEQRISTNFTSDRTLPQLWSVLLKAIDDPRPRGT
jgi:glycosyltransferase involved in cell wall biosynthesis